MKGALLDKNQLQIYFEKMASEHILQKESYKDTYPIPRLKNNFEQITKTYDLLNQHLKLGMNIHPAGEWLLDNYYVIEEVYKTIKKEMNLKKYVHFVGISNGEYRGFARAYVVAAEMVAYTEGNIDRDRLKELMNAYQNKKIFGMEEIWNIPIFLNIALIEQIRNVCDKIYFIQIQKYKVESIIERLVEVKKDQELIYQKNIHTAKLPFSREPFIEYLSFRLNQYGKKSLPYVCILKEQVEKTGTTISEIIKKEHFDIAIKKLTIGNCIKSIKELQRINFTEIFEQVNGVEEILKKDPIGIYDKMTHESKIYYRNQIKELSKKSKVSELYIASKALELANKNLTIEKDRKGHVGYYIVGKGINVLKKELGLKLSWRDFPEKKARRYVSSVFILSSYFDLFVSLSLYFRTRNTILCVLFLLFSYIPISEIVIKTIQYILSKSVKSKLIFKIDFSEGIPEEQTTIVIMPTILKSKKNVQELMKKLEVYYLANQSKNLYFTLLGDCTTSTKEKEDFDLEVIEEGKKKIQELNEKYAEIQPIFHFVYRRRIWNSKENKFLGWERKRGLICEFNDFLLGKKENTFQFNSWENIKLPKVQYILTLDSDTNLVLDSAKLLIGAMAHPLNAPIIDEKRKIIVEGHAILQPRVGIDLVSSRKTLFTKIYAGMGGTDAYSNAISDIYQDNFDEGIFTGKGIYHLKIFHQVLENVIPENTVLSHDLLEGIYARCGLITDVILLDSYPTKMNSYIARMKRWTRGDWQIIDWLRKKVINQKGNSIPNPINEMGKFKIIDNLRRSLLAIMQVNCLLLLFLSQTRNLSFFYFVIFLSIFIDFVLDLLNTVIFKKEGVKKQSSFENKLPGLKLSSVRALIDFSSILYRASVLAKAICITLYRVYKSKEHLLEWTTAEEVEKNSKEDLISFLKEMWINPLVGGIAFFISLLSFRWGILLVSILWMISPIICYYISKKMDKGILWNQLNTTEQKEVLEIAKHTWQFFEDFLTEDNHYLPTDNFQEFRIPKIVDRTSSTNIGLALVSIISAYDLQFIDLEKTLFLLQKMLETIQMLPKWNGHLYNWYHIKTLEPLRPKYVSTVDSGNFVGYLMLVKVFLQEIPKEQKEKYLINIHLSYIDRLIKETDFSKLYNPQIALFSIGFNIEENKLTDSYYDLLASEARQASLVAIAKKDVPAKHWNRLSRVLTTVDGKKGLVSWSGTAFEYLMPNINIRNYKGSLLEESCQFMIMSQRKYCQKLHIPWGISEAAFNLKDLNSNYQYKAFGIPWLGLKRGLSDDLVVSSYGSMLAIAVEPKEVIKNLKLLKQYQMQGKYGLYESVDFTPERLGKNKKFEVVKTYMAHHQGLILLSINNLVNHYILQERFHRNPSIQAVDILLQERLPEDVIITKERKEKIEKIKYNFYDTNYYYEATNFKEELTRKNVISNENYICCMQSDGTGFSKYKNILIHRYKPTDEKKQGVQIYFKNIKNKKIWSSFYSKDIPEFKTIFTADKNEIIMNQDNIRSRVKCFITPSHNVEIRYIEIENIGKNDEILEISSLLEPVLSTEGQDYAHKAFNNLFLKYEEIENGLLIQRNKRGNSLPISMAIGFFSNKGNLENLEYEIDKENLYGRLNKGIPRKIETSEKFTSQIGYVVDPIVCVRRTIKIKPIEKIELAFIMSVSEERETAIQQLESYKNFEKIQRAFEIAKIRNEEMARYLQMTGKEMLLFQKLLSYTTTCCPLKKRYQLSMKILEWKKENLWQYGISGDYPIILLKVSEISDIYVVKELLKAVIFFQNKNIRMDLIILDEEKNVYERYVRDGIEKEITNKNLTYLKNNGIYLLNANELETVDMLYFKASIIIDSNLGSLENCLTELEEEYIKNRSSSNEKIELEEETSFEKCDISKMNLEYFNGFGGFDKGGKEYIINVDEKVPSVWSNILANEQFGTIITQNLGGFTWYKNSRLNRITRWSNDTIEDTSSEEFYIQDETEKKVWKLGKGKLLVRHGMGYSIFEQNKLDIKQKLEVFVSMKHAVKINILHLQNNTNQNKKINIIYKIDIVLDEDEIKSNGHIVTKYEPKENLIYAKNLFPSDISSISYLYSSEKINSYTGNKDNVWIYSLKKLNQENALGSKPCMAIQICTDLKAFEKKEISFVLGACEKVGDWQLQYKEIQNCKEEYLATQKYWENLLERVKVKTPSESTNIMLNGWTIYQTIASRLYARSGFYQSGGAWGFRDQLQDVMGLLFFDKEKVKQQILKHAAHQFIEGDVEHWWHDETGRGIRTKFSDDRLWMVYVVLRYIEFTGDKSILDISVPYIQGNLLKKEQDENYDLFKISDKQETLYNHCLRAIGISLSFGKNNLPLIGSGDWNDGFSTVGNKGKGESVWLGFFLYDILNQWISILKERKEDAITQDYQEKKDLLKKALNKNGWDGRWFRRAYTDDGDVLGSIENEECRIDSISQSWSVIANAGDNDKKYTAMENLEKYLLHKDAGIIKLLDPPFEKSKLNPGYIQSYLPGVRENGGQYTHAAIWTVIAFAKLKLQGKAFNYYNMINPIKHSNTKEKAERYKLEPYSIPADIYGSQNLLGRGGWSWYTGSSSWYYIAGIESILGLQIKNNILTLDPCVPEEWDEYFIQYKYGESIYNIKVKNKMKTNQVQKFYLNNEEIKEKQARLIDNQKINEIEIVI